MLQNWDGAGLIKPHRKQGRRRGFSEDDIFEILLLEKCKAAGIGTQDLHSFFGGVVKKITPDHEYIVIGRREYILVKSGQNVFERLSAFCKRVAGRAGPSACRPSATIPSRCLQPSRGKYGLSYPLV